MTRKEELKSSRGCHTAERYLKIPYHILSLRQIGLCEKVVLSWFYSFGMKGCFQSNKNLSNFFMVSAGSIKRWIADLVKADLVQIKCPKGYYRTIWAKSHPEVKGAAQLCYRGRKIENRSFETNQAQNAPQSGQKCASHWNKSELPLGQKCVTTNKYTKKETIENTTATPSPLPAGGQAAALPEDKERMAVIKKFKEKFGIGRKKRAPLTEKEFDQRRNRQLAALRV